MKFTHKLPFKRPNSLDELFADDSLGLLEDVGKAKLSMKDTDKVVSDLEEIKAFIVSNQRLPKESSDSLDEKVLARKYKKVVASYPDAKNQCNALLPEELRSSVEKTASRSKMTRDELIKKEVEAMQSQIFTDLDSVLDSDIFGLLDDDDGVGDCVVEHEHWRDTERYKAKQLEFEEPAARATPCKEFFKYAPYFEEAKRLLYESHLKQEKIVGGGEKLDVLPGSFYIVDGVLSLIVEGSKDESRESKAGRKSRYRVRQIFDNGTESYPFSTSVKASFYKSVTPSMRLVETDEEGHEFIQKIIREVDPFFRAVENIDQITGYVYILATQSTDPVIREFLQHSHLVKIGYTSNTVEERIANAADEPTYLCAPVQVLKSIKCIGLDAHVLEDALHTIFAGHKLNVTLHDRSGKSYRPREWFTVSYETAVAVVEHIIAGDLNLYYVDPIQGKLKLKQKYRKIDA